MSGCPGDPVAPPPDQAPEILDIEAPTPVLEGSLLRVTGLRLELIGPDAFLAVDGSVGGDDLPLEEVGGPGEVFFRVTPNLVNVLGRGPSDVTAILRGDSGSSNPFPFFIDVALDLPVALSEAPSGSVSYNDEALLRGDGFVSPTEGTVTARFEGTFVEESGPSRSVSVGLPVLPAERGGRDRGLVRLTTALGSVHPGTFDGTLTLESTLASGARTTSSAQTVSLSFQPPELFGVDPTTVSLEQIVTVRGSGFLGGPDEPDETTVIRLSGEFDPSDGAPAPFDEELVLIWVSGTEMQTVIRADERRGELISELFRARRGTFVGTATPIVIKGADEHEGATVPFMFTLAQVRQVVFVRFLPGFYQSLPRFGLEAGAGEVEALIAGRIDSIFDRWNVDVRLEQPTDFSENGYSTLEIGGPDPNGIGLFGYDNSPGKDVGNVRLYDKIGGSNWETQENGYRGFGGVFVESMLYFSHHPDLPGDEPPSRPDPDDLFDEIFDPVRTGSPATLAEIRGEGPGPRVMEVRRALEALANMVGETTSHELGHSFGLAEPFGPPTVFHNAFDEEGCLMDNGGNRPIGERTAQPGFAATRLCHSAPAYLDDILGE
jgi:hypothetical protein